jgi:penicillin-binding protein 1A
MTRRTSLLLRFASIILVGVVSISVVGALLVPEVVELRDSASFDAASPIALPALLEGSDVLDRHGDPMGQLVGAENREVIPLDRVSEELVATVLAVEDADFYDHNGVSARSILRALRANSEQGQISQGGSTITQQLVKLSLVGDDRTFSRKVKEASLAIQLENQFCDGAERKECKDRILEQYLNLVYLGRGAYGVQAAARTYFGMDAADVGWAEAAVLTSLIRNPNGYDPIEHPELARERREIVVRRMQDEDLVTEDQAALINLAPLPTSVQDTATTTRGQNLTYFERKIRDELLAAEWLAPTEELRRHLIFNGGLTIHSTFDPHAQQLAEAASATNPVAERNPETVAVVAAVEPSTGAVRAVVGETDVPGRGVVEVAAPVVGRSPGSSFKTFTLLAALERGHSLRDSISASPAPRRFYKEWGITSSSWPSGCRGGSVTLRRATASSNNCAFVRLQAAVGGDEVVDVAQRLGINTLRPDDGDVASLTLGSASVRPLEMAGAYAAIANDGRFNPPHFVTKVEDRDGNVLFEYEPRTEQAISVEVARLATDALQAVVESGTYSGGSLPDRRPAAGKTGTNEATNGENTDVWFVGFTPQLATAVWIGNPTAATAIRGGRVQGGTVAARVWREFMHPYHEDLPVLEFPEAEDGRSREYISDPWRRSSSSSRRSGSGSSSGSSSSGSSSSGSSSNRGTPDSDSDRGASGRSPRGGGDDG